MHNIYYWDFDENCDRKSVLMDIQDLARHDGDGYSGPLKWHDEVKPVRNRDEAEKWIQSHDKGFYDDHAVRYYDYSKATETKKIADLKTRASECATKVAEYKKAHSVRNFKAEFLGCQKCGSKVSRKYLRSECCPLCGNDLRSPTTLSKIKELEEKRQGLFDRIKEETEKQTNNRTVRWLVKFEYHS